MSELLPEQSYSTHPLVSIVMHQYFNKFLYKMFFLRIDFMILFDYNKKYAT